MFQRIISNDTPLWHIVVDGNPVPAQPGETVAQAMLAHNLRTCRSTAVSGAARGPYCLMGICFDCLVTIDGEQNLQGCLVPVQDGMQITSQAGARRLAGIEEYKREST